jgi:hypothetical protein
MPHRVISSQAPGPSSRSRLLYDMNANMHAKRTRDLGIAVPTRHERHLGKAASVLLGPVRHRYEDPCLQAPHIADGFRGHAMPLGEQLRGIRRLVVLRFEDPGSINGREPALPILGR